MKTNKKQKNIPYSITRDSCANVKILKELERGGYVKIFDVMLENGRENKKVKEKILSSGVWNHSKYGESVWAGNDCKYDKIREIIGKENIKDAMHIEAHIKKNNGYFITEDTDFLDKKEELKKIFDVEILTPVELQAICQN